MGKWVHRLSEIDENARTALCASCGPVTIRRKGPKGGALWRCNKAFRKKKYKRPYRRYAKPHCERCGFVAIHPRQLDVHHIDTESRQQRSSQPRNCLRQLSQADPHRRRPAEAGLIAYSLERNAVSLARAHDAGLLLRLHPAVQEREPRPEDHQRLIGVLDEVLHPEDRRQRHIGQLA